MPIEILMPALSPTMTEGNLAKWLKKEGDKVKPGDILAEIETDKATMEVEAVDEGILGKIFVNSGSQNVPVNNLIALLLEEGEKIESLASYIPKNIYKENKEIPAAEAIISKVESSIITIDQSIDRIKASPLAKKIAELENVELSTISGTGPYGRIIKDDVIEFKKNNKTSNSSSIGRNSQEYVAIPNSNMRKVIAKRLLESKLTIPHFYLSIECNLDKLLSVREEINFSNSKDKSEIKTSINDYIIKATALALKEVPAANVSWTEGAILQYNNIDISIAVAIDGGLITPIIRNADQKSISHISQEMKQLAKRAKENSLKPEEFQGGGFSISNLGMYGIKQFKAIVNPPQSCILAVGAGSKRPVVIDDKITIANMLDVSLSSDHRAVDGAVAAEFLASFKKFIENPLKMFI